MQAKSPPIYDSYRDADATTSFAFLPEESTLLIECGRWMALAGAVGCIDVVVSIWQAFRDPQAVTFVSIAIVAVFATFTLEAGLVLRRLRGDAARDYRAIAKVLGRLHVLFAIKGVLFVALVLLAGLVFVLPLLLYFFR